MLHALGRSSALSLAFAVIGGGATVSAQLDWQRYEAKTLEPGQVPSVSLPLTFSVADGSYLYVNYRRIEGEVVVSSGPEGRLYVNGEEVLGPSSEPEEEYWTEQQIEDLFVGCGVTAIVQRVRAGLSWTEARDLWLSETCRIEKLVHDIFMSAIKSGVERSVAGRRAAAAGMEADTMGLYVHPNGIIAVEERGVSVDYAGFGRVYALGRPPGGDGTVSAQERAERADTRALVRATYLYESLADPGHSAFIVLTPSGMMAQHGADLVAECLGQLERARLDQRRMPAGPLDARVLRGLLEVEGNPPQW